MLNIQKLAASTLITYHASQLANPSNAYYSQRGESVGMWHDTLASEIGLTGPVTEEQFARIMNGQDPHTGGQLIAWRGVAPPASLVDLVEKRDPVAVMTSEQWEEVLGDTFIDGKNILHSSGEAKEVPLPGYAPSLTAPTLTDRQKILVEMHEVAAEVFRKNLQGAAGAEVRDYLASRGVTAESIQEFGIGLAVGRGQLAERLKEYGPDLMKASGLLAENSETQDRFWNRIMLPIQDVGGNTIAFGGRRLNDDEGGPKYLNSPSTELYTKGDVLYNLNRAAEATEEAGKLIVVEGYLDVIAAHPAGQRNVVSQSGTALTENQVALIKQVAPTAVLNLDSDGAGYKSTKEGIRKLLAGGVRVDVVTLPDGHDPASFAKEHGAKAYGGALGKPQSVVSWLVDHSQAGLDPNDPIYFKLDLFARVKEVFAQADPEVRPWLHRQFAAHVGAEIPKELLVEPVQETGAPEKAGTTNHIGGWDIVLRPGKSVSLAALVGGDTRLRQAVWDANEKAMQKYEQYAQQRMGGFNAPVTTGKWIRATFHHDTARPVDGYPSPLLHAHNIIPNMTSLDGDGQARALWAREMYKAQGYAHAIFHSEVAKSARTLGYRVGRGEAFSTEIQGFSREYLDSESQRHQRIRERLKAAGIDYTPQASDIAAKEWRESKLELTPEQVKAIHRAHGEEFGSQAEKIVNEAVARGPAQAVKVTTPEQAVEFARRRLMERTAVFDRYEVVRDALRYGAGTVDVDQVEAEVDRRVGIGNLVDVQHVRGTAPGARYTTPEMVELEQDSIARVLAGKEKVAPILATADLSNHPKLQGNQQRQKVLEGFLKTTDQVTALNGTAGSGKSTALAVFGALAEEQGFSVIGLAPSGRARDEFTAKGVKSETLQRHVVAFGKQAGELREKIVYLLDEASLADTKRVNQFFRTLRPQDRAILIGDDTPDPDKVSQHTSIEAGRVFQQLQRAGMKTAQLNKIYRQKDPGLKKIVLHLRHGKTKEAVGLMGDQKRIVTYSSRKERYAAIAQEFVTHPKKTLVVSPDNRSREALNIAIRVAMRAAGLLSLAGYDMPVLVARDVTGMDRTRSVSYQPGDVVRYIRGSEELGVEAKSYGTILDVDPETNELSVQVGPNRVIKYDPSRIGAGVSVYEKRLQEFASGDHIQFTSRNNTLGTSTRDTGVIKALDTAGNIEVVLDRSNRLVRWNLRDDNHIDYAYTMTSHSAQSMTTDRVLINVETKDSRVRGLLNRVFAYVAGSRPEYDLQVFVDDPEQLTRVLSREHEAHTALAEYQTKSVTPEYKRDRLMEMEMAV